MHVLCFYIFCPSWLRWKLTYYLTGYVRLPLRLDAFNFRHWSQYLEHSASVDLLKEMPKDIFPPGFSSNIIIYDP